MDQALAILEEMLTQRGVFQAQIHFSSSQITIWMNDDPHRYRILDIEAVHRPDICLVYPCQPYPTAAAIPPEVIAPILRHLRSYAAPMKKSICAWHPSTSTTA